jgi:HNH endonuclease
MGFQVGHVPFNDWSHVNEKIRNDPKVRAKWLKSKKGQIAWNTGLTKDQYPNGIASGEKHGNWMGGNGGVRDTAAFAEFRRSILKRDRWTCRECGDHNHKGRGKRIVLHVDHIVSLCVAPELAMEPENARTLCFDCHKRTETYGTKVIAYRKKLKKTKGVW